MYPPIKNIIITNKFSTLREKEKINREHLAVRLGISSSAVQDLETCSNHNPHISLILKYMKYFKVGLKDLVRIDNIELGDAM